jgi:hypothetical protein
MRWTEGLLSNILPEWPWWQRGKALTRNIYIYIYMKNCAVLERQGNFRSGWENHCMRAKTIIRPSPSLRKSQSRFFQSDEIFEDLFHPKSDTCCRSNCQCISSFFKKFKVWQTETNFIRAQMRRSAALPSLSPIPHGKHNLETIGHTPALSPLNTKTVSVTCSRRN